MKTVSNSIKNALKQPTTQRKGRILVNGTYYEVFNVEYNADCYDDGKVIGNAIASQLDFEMPYIDKFDTFKYYDGIWTGNGYEYVDLGTFHVFDEKNEDDFNKHITAFDNLILFNTPFEQRGTYPKTLYNELQNICQQAGVTLGVLSIPNGSFVVENNQFVSGESNKTVLKQICAISGTYGIIKNDMLYLQLKNTTNETLTKNQHDPVDWKRRSYGINQVIIGDSQVEGEYVVKQDDADIAVNGVHKLEILDNLFAYTQEKRQQLLNALYNQVHGFGYIPYETKGEWLNYLEIGDIITIDDTETIVLRINGKSPKAIESTISAPAIIDSSIEYVNNTDMVENQLKRTERTVDKQNQTITDVVEQTAEQNTKISQITQRVDEIESEIQNISGMVVTRESYTATVSIEDVGTSEPVQIIVKPVGENISYLYPNTNLFPSNTTYLKARTIMFTRTYVEDGVTKTQEIPYILPNDLLYYDSNHYDEFYLNYQSQTCQVTKRCKYNADGSVGLLSGEQIIPYEYPLIELGEGDYTVTLLGYSSSYISATLMAKNMYTDQFYTKVETNSKISQTAENITINVNQRLTNYSTTNEMNTAINVKADEITSSVSSTYATKDELTTTRTEINQTTDSISSTVATKVGNNEIISKINQSAESITINASKINLSGYLTISSASNTYLTQSNASSTYASKSSLSAGTTTISGGCITTGTIDASKVNVTNLNASNITSGTITASSISLGNGKFAVTTAGVLTATSGTIGGWNLYSTNLQKQIGEYSFEIRSDRAYNEPAMLIYKNQGSNQGYKFYVRPDGYLYATSGSISGGIVGSGINASYITAGTLNIHNDNAGTYLTMGFGTNHPRVSGLNIDGGGGLVCNTGGTFSGTVYANSGFAVNANAVGQTTVIYSTTSEFKIGSTSGHTYLQWVKQDITVTGGLITGFGTPETVRVYIN